MLEFDAIGALVNGDGKGRYAWLLPPPPAPVDLGEGADEGVGDMDSLS